ncbi:MAG: fibronectin type III domain-containing protein, partial [Anaerolineae bacterium]
VIATPAADATAYSDTGLTCGTTYTYRVKATNAAGDSAYSNEATATTDACPSNLLINGSFEDPIGAEWQTGGTGDQRFAYGGAADGGFLYLFDANDAQEFIRQTGAVSGSAGDKVTLTFAVAGQGLPAGGAIGARVDLLDSGVVDSAQCLVANRGSFNWQTITCTIDSAAAAFTEIRVSIGWQSIASGLLGIDNAILITE